MQLKFCFILLSLALIQCLKGPTDAIKVIFLTKRFKVLGGIEGEDYTTNGKQAVIQKQGEFIASGESEEGNIVVTSSEVTLYLQNLVLSSQKNSPIIAIKNCKNVKIINLESTELIDLEDKKTTTGECYTIKVGQKSSVSIENQDIFKLKGECKSIIATIAFEKAEGEYTINAKKLLLNLMDYYNSMEENSLLQEKMEMP